MKILKSDVEKMKPFLRNTIIHVVVHLGLDQTYEALKLSKHNPMGMKYQLKKHMSECTICQKIKWQRLANLGNLVDDHLYRLIL